MKLDFEKTAVHVSLVSIFWNLVLSVLKLIAGIVGRSGAMISDAVHSASDVFSSLIVMVGVKFAGQESDDEHPYGHERLECVAAILLAVILAGTGLTIGYKAVISLIHKEYVNVIPGIVALGAAIISIITKEAMFWYTRHYAKLIDSAALMASAWHHRSDALSSVGALIGIGGAIIGFPFMEPIASIVICGFILKVAAEIFVDATDKMVDKSCDPKLEDEMRDCALATEGVLRVDLLRTRIFGNKIYVEMEIGADETLTLKESHDIAQNVHDTIEKKWPKVKHIIIHVNPVIKEKTST